MEGVTFKGLDGATGGSNEGQDKLTEVLIQEQIAGDDCMLKFRIKGQADPFLIQSVSSGLYVFLNYVHSSKVGKHLNGSSIKLGSSLKPNTRIYPFSSKRGEFLSLSA